MLNFVNDRQVLEFVKNKEHFVLVYPNTPAGRTAAKGALRDWLVDCELDFDGRDAEMFKKAIDVSRMHTTLDRSSERRLRWGRP